MDMIGNLFIQLFRALFAFIDFIIYGVISLVYNLFIQISDTGIFGTDVFQRFSTRIYSIIGIVMLFKLAFSLITYIVNPDDFSSKEKGMGKLITNIMVTLVLIVITPTIFSEAFNLQRIIIKENVIGQLILGDVLRQNETTGKVDDGWYQTVGDEMSFTIASAFVVPTDEKCKTTNWDDTDSIKTCADAIAGKNGDQALITAFTEKKASGLFNLGLVNAMNDGVFMVDYTMLISTIAGGLTAWIFFIFCIDIATRSVKLAFMQLIAPIPIISYIDPKSGKSGIFSKWVKECLKTFADLFVRILAIYFCIFVISELTRSPMFILSSCDETMNNCTAQTNPFVLVFIILGVLMFAGKLPKLIEDMFGVKMGGFTLNPMKKLGQSPILSAAIGGIGGGLLGGAGNLVANNLARKKIGNDPSKWTEQERNTKSNGRTFLSALGGFGSGMLHGGMAGAAGGGKGSVLAGAGKGAGAAGQGRQSRSSISEYNQENPNDQYGFIARNIRDPFYRVANIKNKDAGIGQMDMKIKQLTREMENSQQAEHSYREAMGNYIASNKDHSAKDFSTLIAGLKDNKGNTDYFFKSWDDYEKAVINQDFTGLGGEALTKVQAIAASDVRFNQTDFEAFRSLQDNVDFHDAEHEKLRKERSRLEDVQKAKEQAEKK